MLEANNGTLAEFSAADSCLFAGCLLLCIGLGLLFGLLGHKTPTFYFLGGRQLRPTPVGISAGVTALPAAAFVTLSGEAFAGGGGIVLAPIFGGLSFFLVSAFIIEVLRPLKLDSLGAYFLARFRGRLLVHFFSFLALFCVLPSVGLQLQDPLRHFLTLTGGRLGGLAVLAIVSCVVIFSTALGGFRSVVWTAVVLAAVLLAGSLAIIFKSVIDTPGGMATILRLNMAHGRIALPQLSFDPRSDRSLFARTVAAFIAWGLAAAQPIHVQRLSCTVTRREAYLVATTASATLFAFSILPVWAGVNMFGYFAHRGCDVLLNEVAKRNNDDLVIVYAREALDLPGCRGLILAAVFGGALCYFSAGINALAGVLWSDFLAPRYFRHAAHRSALLVSRLVTVGCGLLAMTGSFVVFLLGASIQNLLVTHTAAFWAPYLGILLLVATFRRAHPVGVIIGALIASAVTCWLGIASAGCSERQDSAPMGHSDACRNNSSSYFPPKLGNSSLESSFATPAWLPCISPLWLAPLCLILTMALSFGASLCCCCLRDRYLRRRRRRSSRVGAESSRKRSQDSDCLYVSLSTIEH